MNDNTKYIIPMLLHWIEKGLPKMSRKIHNLVTTEDPFQNVTMNKMQS
jgi:hypothetical protein